MSPRVEVYKHEEALESRRMRGSVNGSERVLKVVLPLFAFSHFCMQAPTGDYLSLGYNAGIMNERKAYPSDLSDAEWIIRALDARTPVDLAKAMRVGDYRVL